MADRRKAAKRKAVTADSVSGISESLERLERKVDLLRREQKETERDAEKSAEAARATERDVKDIEKDIDRIESSMVRIGKFSVGREHFMELARGAAGAFMGVGVGLGIRWIPDMARALEWSNAIGILAFIMAIGSILIYKNERNWIEKQGSFFVAKRLMHLLVISVSVEIIALTLFNVMPSDPEVAAKTLIVGLFPAMSGAITFTIT
jgi:hypothetical protein